MPSGPTSCQVARSPAIDILTVSSRARSTSDAGCPCRASCSRLATSRVRVRPKFFTTRLPLSSSVGRTRNATSKPSSTRSTARLLTRMSMRTCGWRARNCGRIGPSVVCASVTGQATRISPRGSVCACATVSAAAWAFSRMATQWRWNCSPTAVSDSLRVVRCNRRTPRRASNSATRREIRDLGKPSARPAAAKPPRSTTSAKYTKSFKSCIAWLHSPTNRTI